MQSESASLWAPTVIPYMRYKHLLLDLISFVQFNKKEFYTILNRYVQHDRLIPQMKMVLFQVVGIIVRTASMACLQGDGSKDKKRCKIMGKACILNIYFLKNANTVVIFHALAGLERVVLCFWAPVALQSVLLAERTAFRFWIFVFFCL